MHNDERDCSAPARNAIALEYDDDEMLHGGARHARSVQRKPIAHQRMPSTTLESVMLELKSLDGTLGTKLENPDVVEDLQDYYLSSEEDSSSSSDYEDSLLSEYTSASGDFSDLTSQSSSSVTKVRRSSQKDTAKAIHITMVSKPQIVQISGGRSRSVSRDPSPAVSYRKPLSFSGAHDAAMLAAPTPSKSAPRFRRLHTRSASTTSAYPQDSHMKVPPTHSSRPHSLVPPAHGSSTSPPQRSPRLQGLASLLGRNSSQTTLSQERPSSIQSSSSQYTDASWNSSASNSTGTSPNPSTTPTFKPPTPSRLRFLLGARSHTYQGSYQGSNSGSGMMNKALPKISTPKNATHSSSIHTLASQAGNAAFSSSIDLVTPVSEEPLTAIEDTRPQDRGSMIFGSTTASGNRRMTDERFSNPAPPILDASRSSMRRSFTMPAGLSLGDALHKIQSRSDVISGDSTMKAKDGQKDSTLDEFAKLGARDSRAPKIKSFKELEMAALSQQHEANQGKTGAHQPIDNIRAVTVLGDVSDQPCLSNDAHASWGSVFKRGRRK